MPVVVEAKITVRLAQRRKIRLQQQLLLRGDLPGGRHVRQPAQVGEPLTKGHLPHNTAEDDAPMSPKWNDDEDQADDEELVSIADAAAECGVSLETFISQMVDSGMLLEHPNGGYTPSPHPAPRPAPVT